MLTVMDCVFQPLTMTVRSLFLKKKKKGNGITHLRPFISIKHCDSPLLSLFKLLYIRFNVAHLLLFQVVQGLVVGKLTSRCTERTLLRLSVFAFAGVGLGMVRLDIKSPTVPLNNTAA